MSWQPSARKATGARGLTRKPRAPLCLGPGGSAPGLTSRLPTHAVADRELNWLAPARAHPGVCSGFADRKSP